MKLPESMPGDIKIGPLGESIAAAYLLDKGYTIVGRNYTKPWGEIDIIAKKGRTTHFFEVKTVRVDNKIDAAENLHPQKIKRVLRAAQSYVGEKRVGDWQIDGLLIILNPSTKHASVELLEHLAAC